MTKAITQRLLKAGCQAGLALFFTIPFQYCWACHAPPQEQLIGVDEQLAKALDVSVATVVRATPMDGQMEYEFLVQKRIVGSARGSFTLKFHDTPQRQDEQSFDNHQAERFWQRGGGRLFNDTTCLIDPTFVVGHSYLAFVGQPITRRSFERIESTSGQLNFNDKWLQYVEAKLRGRQD
ncbi:hypothetical protein LPN04_07380 [Rugamonas sp. A1-17]|nr:hypothetical protein [Rugamonas sp. A1-17]